MRVLSRTWQMLLKGIAEVKDAGRPLAAAEMVLVRIAYAADLPTPDEVIRSLDDGGRSASGARRDAMAARRHRRRAAARGAIASRRATTRRAARRAARRSRIGAEHAGDPAARRLNGRGRAGLAITQLSRS